jgi:hypothetical protein
VSIPSIAVSFFLCAQYYAAVCPSAEEQVLVLVSCGASATGAELTGYLCASLAGLGAGPHELLAQLSSTHIPGGMFARRQHMLL